jgi:hypothetical protein
MPSMHHLSEKGKEAVSFRLRESARVGGIVV